MFGRLIPRICLFMAYSGAVFAQDAGGQGRAARLDVQKYTIDANINPRTQSVSATARIDLSTLEPTGELSFELNSALTVSKVVDARGQVLPSVRNPQDSTLRITLPASLAPKQPTQIAITYSGKLTGSEESPVPGIKFAALHPDYGYLLYPSRWFPVSDYTIDRYQADLNITAPAEFTVLGSGDVKTSPAASGQTLSAFHYDQSSFPGSLAFTKVTPAKVSSQGFNSNLYFREDAAAQAKPYGEEAGKVMSFLVTQFGLAPQANIAIIETEAGAVNGYSAPGLIFLAPSSITAKVNNRILANQLSRQWWGNFVSPVNRNQFWLENGPARFAELTYLQSTGGSGGADADIRATYVEALTVKEPPVLQASRLEDYSPEYWALTAAKGAAVLNMLRNIVGPENYTKGLHVFFEKYRWTSASSEDFRKVMEQVSNQELRYFFIQWLESSGSPDFKLEYTVFRTQKGFRVVGKVTQDLDTFRMPVDLHIETEGNPEDRKVEVTGTSSEFSVDTFGKPKKLTLDPNHVLLRLDQTMQIAVAIRRGEQFVEINEFSNALREYEKALDVNKNSSLAHYRIGELFFRQNNYQQAANEFRSAINGDLEPRWTEVWAHVYLGKIFDVTGQRDRALNEYKQAIRTHDNTGGAQEEAGKYSTKPYEQKSSDT